MDEVKRSREGTMFFDDAAGHVTIKEPVEGPITVEIYGYADHVSTPSHAGDGPIVIEIRRNKWSA